jgi:hypothetical protein
MSPWATTLEKMQKMDSRVVVTLTIVAAVAARAKGEGTARISG